MGEVGRLEQEWWEKLSPSDRRHTFCQRMRKHDIMMAALGSCDPVHDPGSNWRLLVRNLSYEFVFSNLGEYNGEGVPDLPGWPRGEQT